MAPAVVRGKLLLSAANNARQIGDCVPRDVTWDPFLRGDTPRQIIWLGSLNWLLLETTHP
jgi:hypothetical protein